MRNALLRKHLSKKSRRYAKRIMKNTRFFRHLKSRSHALKPATEQVIFIFTQARRLESRLPAAGMEKYSEKNQKKFIIMWKRSRNQISAHMTAWKRPSTITANSCRKTVTKRLSAKQTSIKPRPKSRRPDMQPIRDIRTV